MAQRQIIITTLPLSVPLQEVLKMKENSENLTAALLQFLEQTNRDLEVYEQHNNIAVTSDGYFGAFYEDDLFQITSEE